MGTDMSRNRSGTRSRNARSAPLSLCDTPAPGGAAEPAIVTLVRLRARRLVLWMRHVWADGLQEPGQGLAIPHSEVDRLLTTPEAAATAEAAFYATDKEVLSLGSAIERLEAQAADDPLWMRICRTFALSPPERDLLALTVAVEVDPRLRRVCGYLHDDANACWPTSWLAAGLFGWQTGTRPGSGSALARWRLAFPLEGAGSPWSQSAPWVADPSVVACLTQGIASDPALDTNLQVVSRVSSFDLPCLFPELRDEIVAFVRAVQRESRTPVEIELNGPAGAGKQTLAAQVAVEMRADLFAADAGAMFGPDVAPAEAAENRLRAARTAKLCGAIVYWHHAGGVNPRYRDTVFSPGDLTFFGSDTPFASGPTAGTVRRTFALPSLTRAQRTTLWKRLAGLPVPAPVSDWTLTPGEIVRAAQAAPAGMEAAAAVCRQQVRQEPGELFTPLACPYTWEDMVLSPGVRRHLAEFESQARLRGPVYEAWGFERLFPLGRGISALFAGPSGTGKTMAAQVIAHALDIELYRVDLAGVMNKYIGETEKRLKRVFDACERANVLLFFDEADALFGHRAQAKDAHDRFANIEIDYLLQRMEQYEGIAVLATNRKSDLDTAFLRRLRFIVDFLPPGPAERLSLWQRVLPERAPDGTELLDGIDWEFLAHRLGTMTGADIKNAALSAAFLACAEETRIGMRHVLAAARREMSKHGVVIRPGEWEGPAECLT